MRAVGEYGPDFVLSCHDSSMTRLSRLQARNDYVVVVFFLVAGSPGCAKELNGYRDLFPEFQKRRVGIVGVSPDPVHALASFAKENPLPFDICSDGDHAVAEEWGTYSERGQMRSTFIINDKSTILHIWPRANVNTNASEALELIDGFIKSDEARAGGGAPAEATQPEAAPAQAAPAAPAPAQAASAPSAPAQAAPAQAAPAPAAAAAPALAPTGGHLGAGDVACAFARTSLQLLLQHVEGGGQVPPDVAELAGRIALLRYR